MQELHDANAIIVATKPGQIAAPLLTFVVRGAVGHPTLLLRDLGATSSVEFVRHLQHPQEDWTQPISAEQRVHPKMFASNIFAQARLV